MENFWRSLRYLRPYRGRLAISVVCVVLIAMLWGGGLAMLLPGAKILMSPEGLHGWAHDSITEDMLGIKLVQRIAPAQIRIEGQQAAIVIEVVEVKEDSPAAKAGITANLWLVGLETASADDRLIRGDVLARRLANLMHHSSIRLRVFNPHALNETASQICTVTPQKVGFSTRVLGGIAGAIEEPTDFTERLPVFVCFLLILVSMTWLRNGLRFFQEYLVQTAVYMGIRDLRCENYAIVLRLPMTFFSQYGTTDTMSRFLNDTGELSRGQIALLSKTLLEPAKAVASLAAALYCSWQLTLLAMIAGPPSYFLIRQLGKLMKKASTRALQSNALLVRALDETLLGMRVVKAYTMEAAERKSFYRVNRGLIKQLRRMARIDSATAPSVEMLGIVAVSGAAALAAHRVFSGHMDRERFLAMMACLFAMYDPVRKLAKVVTRFQRAEAAASRVFELHDQPQEPRDPAAPKLPRHSRTIEFQGVSFRYPSAEADAVGNVDLTIQHGETIAVVGPNGCGKTTLVSLLPRLLEPTAGNIFIDGQDIVAASLRSLRQQIGLVTQETILFHATIKENISYGLLSPNDEAVFDAARRAFVDEFVREMPDGYETMVGEHGATLSGGQRQRIAIARAILRDPAILIFDEATSQIDADSEHRIHEAMEQFIEGRTTIMIAHRFATIMSADRIVVMDGGRIIDVGHHDELMPRCELYAHLYRTQFADTGG